jgi:hypothetical protein
MLALAAGHPRLGVFAGLVAFGFVIGIIGHLTRSRTLVLTGIVVVGVVTAYFAFVYEPNL